MKSPSQYSDVAAVLDSALAAGGGLYRLPSAGKAVHWRLRAYSLRRLLHKLDSERKHGLVPPTSPYDSLILRIRADDPCVVRIELIVPEGELTGLDSLPLTPRQTEDLINDPLFEEIEDLVGKVGL